VRRFNQGRRDATRWQVLVSQDSVQPPYAFRVSSFRTKISYTEIDCSPNCYRFAALSKKRLEIQGLESHHTPPAPDVDLESLSDYSSNREAIDLEEAPVQVPELEASASEDIELYYSIQVVQALLSNACQRASLDTRASAHRSEDGDSFPCSDGDDANSYDTLLISGDESDTEDIRRYIALGVRSPAFGQSTFVFAMCDPGAAVSLLSYEKARLVAPDSISDDVTHLSARTLDILGGTVTVHGPIWVKLGLGDEGNRIQYKTPVYVLPRSYGRCSFDLLLNEKVVQRLGLATIQRHPAAVRETRSASRGGDRQAIIAELSSAD
jgi:hypothetical protein